MTVGRDDLAHGKAAATRARAADFADDDASASAGIRAICGQAGGAEGAPGEAAR